MSVSESERRLLGTIPTTDPLHLAVRQGLEEMRRSGPPELRDLAGAVLDGRMDLRDLARSSGFAPVLAAAAERSREEAAATDPAERARLVDEARRDALARFEAERA